ncbi:MAG: DUF6438 domain-containing protein [Pseudomonadota bacterium]
MMRILLLTFALAGCAQPMANFPSTPIPVEITYETGPCFGTCPVYAVTVNNLGAPAVFDGKRFTAVTGRREVPVSYRQFAAFYDAVADARAAAPADYQQGGAHCKQVVTDMPSVAITFREGSAAPWTFRYYYGCRDPQNAKIAADLRRAPTLLPIGDLIGKR